MSPIHKAEGAKHVRDAETKELDIQKATSTALRDAQDPIKQLLKYPYHKAYVEANHPYLLTDKY